MVTNIAILDCQKMFVDGIISYFQLNDIKYSIKSKFCNAQDLFDDLDIDEINVLLTELNIPDHDGFEVLERIKTDYPHIKIMIVSSFTNFKLVKKAMLNGADGFISKESTLSELTYGIQEIMNGKAYIGDGLSTSPKASSRVILKKTNDVRYEDIFLLKQKLTKREQEILELIAQGKNSKSIGSELFISNQTVGVHRKNILKKLGLNNTASLVKFALEHHLV